MKNSIGSLVALVAFAAPAALAAPMPQAADFNHVPVSLDDDTQINLDIDGDGTDDFYVYGNYGTGLRVGNLNDTNRSLSPLNYGDIFQTTDDLTAGSAVIAPDTLSYYGFVFTTGETTPASHTAWVLFDTNTASPMVVGGGWSVFPETGVYVGEPSPIPEPASYGMLAGALVLTGAMVKRRRRVSSAVNK